MNNKPDKPTRQQRKEARPAELIASALDLFVERGYAATRLDEVAAHAGVSKGTLYLYFASKEELFKAVIREALLPYLREGEQMVKEYRGSSSDLLRELFFGWWESIGSKPVGGITKLMIAEARNFPEIGRFYVEEVIGPGHAILREVLQRGIDREEFRHFEVETMIHIIFSPLIMRAVWHHSVDYCCVKSLPPNVYLKEYVDLLMRGLLNGTQP